MGRPYVHNLLASTWRNDQRGLGALSRKASKEMAPKMTNTCPSCGHQWEEEVDVPEWYDILITRPDAVVTVPPYSHCVAWLDENQKRWHLVGEMSAVVENYWDPKKKKSPWAMLRGYIDREIRESAEKVQASRKNY